MDVLLGIYFTVFISIVWIFHLRYRNEYVNFSIFSGYIVGLLIIGLYHKYLIVSDYSKFTVIIYILGIKSLVLSLVISIRRIR